MGQLTMWRPSVLVVLLSVGLTFGTTLDRMLTSSIDKCIGAKEDTEECFRNRIIEYLGPAKEKHGTPRHNADKGEIILERLLEIINNNEFKIELPEVFQKASLIFRPGRGLDFGVEFPKEEENEVTPRQGT